MENGTISSWNELLAFFEKQPAHDIAYRGQEKSYSCVKSKIDRCLKDRKTLWAKLRTRNRFHSRAISRSPARFTSSVSRRD
jgi:hypothetical protein